MANARKGGSRGWEIGIGGYMENIIQNDGPTNPVDDPDVLDVPNPTSPEEPPMPDPYPVTDPPVEPDPEPIRDPEPGPHVPEPIPGGPPEVTF